MRSFCLMPARKSKENLSFMVWMNGMVGILNLLLVFLFSDAPSPGDLISSGEYSVQLVGGTFHFKGVSSPEQYDVLFSILRLSVYVRLSLLLEQHFLANS